MKIVILNGAPTSGKDSLVERCASLLPEGACLNISTVDYVKQIATDMGWDGTKTSENRRFLSELKDTLTHWKDLPFKDTVGRVGDFVGDILNNKLDLYEKSVVFIHCREPEEIARLQEKLQAITVLVRRDVVDNSEQSNHADSEVDNFGYNIIVENNGTLDDLMDSARTLLTEVLGIRLEETVEI